MVFCPPKKGKGGALLVEDLLLSWAPDGSKVFAAAKFGSRQKSALLRKKLRELFKNKGYAVGGYRTLSVISADGGTRRLNHMHVLQGEGLGEGLFLAFETTKDEGAYDFALGQAAMGTAPAAGSASDQCTWQVRGGRYAIAKRDGCEALPFSLSDELVASFVSKEDFRERNHVAIKNFLRSLMRRRRGGRGGGACTSALLQ